MNNYNSIQEIPSCEVSEASPVKPESQNNYEDPLANEKTMKLRLSDFSNDSSPVLKNYPSSYSRSQKKIIFLNDELEEILKKPTRDAEEAALLYHFMKDFDFFKKFKADHKRLHSTSALVHLCKLMKYEMFAPGETIYKKDDEISQKIYLVLEGEVRPVSKLSKQECKEESISSQLQKLKTAKSLVLDNVTAPILGGSEMKETKASKVVLGVSQRSLEKGNGSLNDTSIERYSDKPKNGSDGSRLKLKVKFQLDRSLTEEENGLEEILSIKKLEQSKMQRGEATLKRKATVQEETKNTLNLKIEDQGLLNDNKALSKPQENDNKVLSRANSSVKSDIKLNICQLEVEEGDGLEKAQKQAWPLRKFIKSKTAFFALSETIPVTTTPKEGSVTDSKKASNVVNPKIRKGLTSLTNVSLNDLDAGMNAESNNTSSYQDVSGRASRNNLGAYKAYDFGILSKNAKYNTSLNSLDNYKQEESQSVAPREKKGFRRGDNFGDRALHSNQPRAETMESVGYTKIVTFTVSDYDFITTRFEKINTKTMNFLIDHVPELEKAIKYDKLRDVEKYFEEQEFIMHNNVIRQGEQGNMLYILYEGICKVYKDSQENIANYQASLETNKRGGDGKLICLIQPGAFIGEEILFDDRENYEYTVKVSSVVIKVLAIKKDLFGRIMPESVVEAMKSLYNSKKEHNDVILSQKLDFSRKMTLQSGKSKLNSSRVLNGLLSSSVTPSSLNEAIKLSEKKQLTSSLPEVFNMTPKKRKLARIIKAESTNNSEYFHELDSKDQSKDLTTCSKAIGQSRSQSLDNEKSLDKDSNQRKLLNPLVMKTWNSQQYLDTDRENMMERVKDETEILKGKFNKFFRVKVFEGIFKNEYALRGFDSEFSTFKDQSTVNKRNHSQGPKLPKIDKSDIKSLKFDFGKDKKSRVVPQDSDTNKEKEKSGIGIDLPTPKDFKSLVRSVLPSKSNFILSIMNTPDTLSSITKSIRTPKGSSTDIGEFFSTGSEGTTQMGNFFLSTKSSPFTSGGFQVNRNNDVLQELKKACKVKKKIGTQDVARPTLAESGTSNPQNDISLSGKRYTPSNLDKESCTRNE